MEEEVWKEIEGYPNYQISNLGRVKSKPRVTKVGLVRANKARRKEKILKPFRTGKGYMTVRLYRDKVFEDFGLSRLVAKVFIKKNLTVDDCVCFRNRDSTDCRVENLYIIKAEEQFRLQTKKYYMYYGVKCDIKRLAKMSGIKEKTLRLRLDELKWNVYEAAEIPTRIFKKGMNS